MQQHPTLIYDGPFSENVLNIVPKVNSEAEITADQAKQKVIEFIGMDRIQEIGSYSEKGEGRIPVYPFYAVLKNGDKNTPVDIDVSKNGGHIVYMLDTRQVGQPALDVKKAIDTGLNFLSSRGYNDMIPSFSQRTDNILTVNYVYTQKSGGNNVVIYPDQIKLKIALDNGDIVGVEAEKFLSAHTSRNIPSPKISVEAARAKASPKVEVTNSRLTIIPLLSKREVFCYEFVGRKGDSTYAIYINAENGNEENILQIIDTPDGQLAM
jgi:germination protein YpeB